MRANSESEAELSQLKDAAFMHDRTQSSDMEMSGGIEMSDGIEMSGDKGTHVFFKVTWLFFC